MDRYTVPFLGVVTWLLMALAKSTEVCYCGPSCCSVPRLCGKAISPRNAFFLSGENLTLVCNVQRGSPWGLTFVRGIFADEVPSKYIQSLNATAIQLVIPNITDEDIRNNNASMQYKCMKEGSNGTCVDVLYVELDYYTVTPQNVSCRIFDFNTMNCSWDLVVKYVHEEAYDVTCEVVNLNEDEVKAVFLSDISKVENFTGEKCPNQSQTSCYWDESRYTAPAVMKLKITVNNTRRNIHKDTGWITFQEYDIVEPDPVKNLRAEDTDTPGCVIIHWEPSTGCKNKNMTYRLIHSSPCSDLQEQRNVQGENNMTVCGLVPYTNYTFSVAGHVLDPLDRDIENGHWSEWNTIYYMTQSAVIETNPTIFTGLYELTNATSQDGQLSLKLYWNPLSKCDLHAPADSVTYTVQWNNLTKTVNHPSFMADILIPNLSALNVSLSTTNNVDSNAKRQILQVYAYGPEPTELVLEINKTSDKCVVYTSLLVGEKGPRYTDVRHTLVWCNKTELYCSAPLRWIDLNQNVTNFTFPRNQCEEQRYGLVTYGYDKGQGHTANTGIHWEPCIYQRGKVPKKPLEDVAMSEIQPDCGFHVTWKRYDCKVSKAYIEHYTVRYCKDTRLCKCKQDPVYVNISRTSDSYTVENLEAGTQVCVWVAGFSKSGLGPFNNLPVTITIKKNSDKVGLIVGLLLAGLLLLVAMGFVIQFIRRKYKRCKKGNQVEVPKNEIPLLILPLDDIGNTDNTSGDFETTSLLYGQGHSITGRDTEEPISSYIHGTCLLESKNSVKDPGYVSDTEKYGLSLRTTNTAIEHVNSNKTEEEEVIDPDYVLATGNSGLSLRTSNTAEEHVNGNKTEEEEEVIDPGYVLDTENPGLSLQTTDSDREHVRSSKPVGKVVIDPDYVLDTENPGLTLKTTVSAKEHESRNNTVAEEVIDPDYVLATENPGLILRTNTAREHENSNITVEEGKDPGYVFGTENPCLSLRTNNTAREHVSGNNTVEEVVIGSDIMDTENPGLALQTTDTETDGFQHERDIDEVFSVMEQVSISVDASSVDVNEEEDNMNNVSDSNEIGENDLSNGNIEGHNSLVTVSSDNTSRIYNYEPLELENNQDDVAQTHNTRMVQTNNESETDCSERRMNENALNQNQGNDLISSMNQDDEAIADTDGIPNLISGYDTELIGGYRSISSIGALFVPGTDSSVTISSDYSSALSDNDSQPSQDEIVQTNEMNIGGENENETDSGASSFTNEASCSSLSDHSGNNSL